MPLIIELPDEILESIVKHLYPRDRFGPIDILGKFRLACRTFARIGGALVVERITVTGNAWGSEKLLGLAKSSLCRYTKELWLDFGGLTFRELDIIDLGEEIIVASEPRFIEILRATLPQFCRLERLRISQDTLERALKAQTLFPDIVQSLSRWPITLKRLELNNVALLSSDPLPNAFVGLQQCMIRFKWTYNDETHFKALENFVRSTILLRNLWIAIENPYDRPPVIPYEFWHTIYKSNLQNLRLEDMTFSQSGLLQFLKDRPAVLRVYLMDPHLVEGSWEPMFIKFRKISRIYCPGPDFYIGNDIEISSEDFECDKAIEDYVRGKTNINPFELLSRE
jgi:hypothetical protein